MKISLVPLLVLPGFFFAFSTFTAAQESGAPARHEAESNWPGIRFQVVEIDRILQNRLLVIVRIQASASAPANGTLLGEKVPFPANLDIHSNAGIAALSSGRYNPKPYLLSASIMIDDISGAQYHAVRPVSPPHQGYLPGGTNASLRPGQMALLSVQFDTPPPPPQPAPGQPVVPQTLTFLFPKATGPITHVPIPPPVGTGSKTSRKQERPITFSLVPFMLGLEDIDFCAKQTFSGSGRPLKVN